MLNLQLSHSLCSGGSGGLIVVGDGGGGSCGGNERGVSKFMCAEISK